MRVSSCVCGGVMVRRGARASGHAAPILCAARGMIMALLPLRPVWVLEADLEHAGDVLGQGAEHGGAGAGHRVALWGGAAAPPPPGPVTHTAWLLLGFKA